jgi:hypothetical protein
MWILKEFRGLAEAVVVVEVDGVGGAVWRGRLGLRTWWGWQRCVVGLSGLGRG